MKSGYVYVLQNRAFGANVIKIGLTTRTPDVRAREIYSRATGVPMPFDIAVAYSVSDCAKAEKLAHKRLRPYRLNDRREFFRVQASVGSSVVYKVCVEVNRGAGESEPERFKFPSNSAVSTTTPTVLQDDDEEGRRPVRVMHFDKLYESPVGTSNLSTEQEERAEILCSLLSKINPVARDKWLEGFTQDEHPEREIKIWESIAKAYLTLEHADDASESFRREAFSLLLERTWSSTTEVLSNKQLKHFSPTNAKRLLDAYELRPLPLMIRRGRGAA